MPPTETLWALDSHTRGKHLVLKNYMGAWLPIMLHSNVRVLFIDAFAGPGKYAGGEEGSPLIALNALLGRDDLNKMRGRIDFLFIEEDLKRARHLEETVAPVRGRLPTGCTAKVIQGTFMETMTSVLDSQNTQMAPPFVMIDPFGMSETPMSLIERILKNDRAEVCITFMYRDINRFKSNSNLEASLDSLFGCPDWRSGLKIDDRREGKDFFYRLYERRLRESGAEFILHFDIYEGRQLVYALFFATKNDLGCDKMKRAMWDADPFGDFRFTGRADNQLSLEMQVVDFGLLQAQLREQFKIGQWIRIESAEGFMRSDKTLFHSGQLKTELRKMESEGTLEVDPESRRIRGTFTDGTRFRFLDSSPKQAPPLKPQQGKLPLC